MKLQPTGKLGQVVKKEEVKTSVKGARAWRIAYVSSDVGGRKTLATALVVAPLGKAPAGGRPIMAWAHGTTGTAQNCGPSQVIDPAVPLNQYFLVGGNSWTDYGLANMEPFLGEGYVIVATDYQGLGGGGRHQYAVAQTNARDVIDSARAARSMKETGAGRKTLVYGWSQGGGATIAAASLPEYLGLKGTAADDLDFIGFVALAPDDVAVMVPAAPTDEAAADKVVGGFVEMFSDNVFNFAHFAMSVWGTQAAYPDLRMTDILTEQGAKVVDEVLSNKCMHVAADTIAFAYGSQYRTLLQARAGNTLAWAKAFIQGSVTPVKPVAPVVVYWGTKDTAVPPVMHELYQRQMCAMGGNVERIQLPGEQSHYTTPGVAAPLYLPWVKDRVAGKPAADGCPKGK
ncbi:MAG TPA: alpha/beta fold hydrolase [Anaeromyxobacteraceae bacterium]|nr:alpha/beta fold hydrolase [Anaeromyxobacteraceae bacterium]